METTFTQTTFTLKKGSWSGTYPHAELVAWWRFYTRQRDLFPKSEASYDATISALETLAKELNLPLTA